VKRAVLLTHTHTYTHTHTLPALCWRHLDPITLTALVTSGGGPTVPNNTDKMSADSRESGRNCPIQNVPSVSRRFCCCCYRLSFFTLVVAVLLLCFIFTKCDKGSCATLWLNVMAASSGSGECCCDSCHLDLNNGVGGTLNRHWHNISSLPLSLTGTPDWPKFP